MKKVRLHSWFDGLRRIAEPILLCGSGRRERLNATAMHRTFADGVIEKFRASAGGAKHLHRQDATVARFLCWPQVSTSYRYGRAALQCDLIVRYPRPVGPAADEAVSICKSASHHGITTIASVAVHSHRSSPASTRVSECVPLHEGLLPGRSGPRFFSHLPRPVMQATSSTNSRVQ